MYKYKNNYKVSRDGIEQTNTTLKTSSCFGTINIEQACCAVHVVISSGRVVPRPIVN